MDADEHSQPTFAQLLKVVKDEHRRKTRALHQWHEESLPKSKKVNPKGPWKINATEILTGEPFQSFSPAYHIPSYNTLRLWT